MKPVWPVCKRQKLWFRYRQVSLYIFMLYDICKNITEVHICSLLHLLLWIIKIIFPEIVYMLIKLASATKAPIF